MTSILIYSTNQSPLASLAAIAWSKIQVKLVAKSSLASPPTVCIPNGIQLEGEAAALRYLCRLADASQPPAPIYCRDPVQAATIDYFIDLAFDSLTKNQEKSLSFLDAYLTLRTFVVGHTLTAGDLAVWGAITALGQKFALPLTQYPHLYRYLSHCSSLPELASAFSTAFPAKKTTSDNSYSGAQAITLDPKLWMGKVVTRFPPEPSGYLHIGHAKAAILNYDLMTRYHGRLILRFDDTNPSKEKQEFVDAIIDDLTMLGVIHTPPITYSSDHFDYLADKCSEMIKNGSAYVDFTEKMKAREEREKMIDGQCRGHSADENLRLWNEMRAGTALGLTCVVRAKISMQHRNAAMRDPAMFRCNTSSHHRTGDKYKVYPTYDFTCPLIDSLEGVTHALRTIEYRDRNEQYAWFCHAARVRKPEIIDFARMNLVNTVLSKRKLTRLVESQVVLGWDDPRFPTVRGMVRRGLQVAALREFVLDQGASKSVALMEWDKIWNMNKKVIDPIAHRYTVVGANQPVPFELMGDRNEAVGTLSIRRLPKDESKGHKTVPLSSVLLLEQEDVSECSLGEEITLMGWGNAIVQSIERDQNGVAIKAVGRLNLSGDFKKTKKKVTWIAADHPDTVLVTLVDLDYLIRTPKLDASLTDEEFEAILNRESWKESKGLGEVALGSVAKGQVVQLNRRGFYTCERSLSCPGAMEDGRGLVLIYIPDGRMTTTSSLSRS